MNRDSLKTYIRSPQFSGIIVGIGIALIALCIFEAGVVVGYHRADFSSHMGNNYDRANGMMDRATTRMGTDEQQQNSHGTFGTIVSVSGSTILIQDGQQPEVKVLTDSSTVVRSTTTTTNTSALTVGTSVVVIGTPNDQGEIVAKLIRINPAPQGMPSVNSTTSPYAAP